MKAQHDDLLDTPVSPPQRFPLWAVFGAAGIIGVIASTVLRFQYLGFFEPDIKVGDILTIPSWLFTLGRASALTLLFGVVLTVLRKEPRSSFRSWVIGIGAGLLLLLFFAIGFSYYMDFTRGE